MIKKVKKLRINLKHNLYKIFKYLLTLLIFIYILSKTLIKLLYYLP